MDIKIHWPDSVRLAPHFPNFLQSMANRIVVGTIRYSEIDARKAYMTRMDKELAVYKRTGNQEHLFNLANYAYLESVAPQHSNSHHDPHVKSVTRRSMGGAKEE